MKISLRKANALQIAINEAISGISLNAEIDISEFENPSEVIDIRKNELLKNISKRMNLTGALYNIRKSVNEANHTSGIDNILTDIVQLEKSMQVYSALSKQRPMIDEKVIIGKLDKIRSKATGEAFYGHETSVKTSFLLQSDLDSFKSASATFKKEKQKLQDQLLELNVRTEIDLNADTVKILETEQLL